MSAPGTAPSEASSATPQWMLAKERLDVCVFQDDSEASTYVARLIANLIVERQRQGRPCVLGLATGSTPCQVYSELVRLHREDGLSFANVVTFNLDEYYPMDPGALQSYHRFMREHLFDHVDLSPENIHIPDGSLPSEEVAAHCREYERAIQETGGIDLQLLGLGRGGHIGFNERGSGKDTITRLVYLDTLTRTDAASDFFGRASVPRQAISMGVSTILGAKRVILLAFGEGKAAAVRATVEDAPGSHYPASFLQSHPSATVILDRGAAQELTRVAAPWTLAGAQDMVWRNVRAVCEAVCWLSRQRNRPILQLRAEDYAMCAALQALFAEHSFAAAKVNQMVFDVLTAKLTRDPTFALPPAVESHVPSTFTSRPEGSARGGAKRVLLLSPHPDDDVISMGGTLALLTQQGHEVWVGYQTSGAIAVKDEDLLDRLAFTAGLEAAARLQGSKGGGSPSEPRVNEYLPEGNETGTVKEASDAKIQGIVADLVQQVEGKGPLDPDPLLVQRAKALVRQCEARSAAAACGVPSARLRFLDSPFYQTGTVVKAPLTQADIQLVADLVSESSPDVVFLAGDLSDPHGTHRTCLEAALRALSQSRQDPNRPLHPDVLLYRGAWQEWAPHDADLLVPLTPEELQRKLGAIKRHQSQKDPPLYPGVDGREFWERAEDRNRGTAEALRALGLPSFEGVEAFVRCTAVEGGGWEILGGSVKLRG